MARICKALGNPVRLQIVRYIVHHPDCIGNDILLHLPEEGPHAQSTLSRHLRVLREASLIDAREDGAAMCYSINHSSLEWLCQQLNVLDAGS
jgi:DNA-binding transcriptional ArsR family regulator